MDLFSSCLGSSSRSVRSKTRSGGPSDDEIIRFENELKLEQAAQDPLISAILPITVLHEEFPPQSSFQAKLDTLEQEKGFKSLRKCRRDGNCFYRAVAFELIIFFQNPQNSELINGCKANHKSALKAAGYEETIYEDFSEAFWSFCTENGGKDDDSCTLEELWTTDEYSSNMAIMLLRLLASAEIRSNPDEYSAFIELGPQESIPQWCERNVDAVGVDADQVQLIALARSMQIALVVVNLGNASDDHDLQINEFNFSEDESSSISTPLIHLLYRPGHYDLLYK